MFFGPADLLSLSDLGGRGGPKKSKTEAIVK